MRFSLRTLLVGFAFISVGCAGFLYANRLWATSSFTAALLFVVAGGVASLIRRGQAQAYWIGLTLFSGAYFWVAMFSEKLDPTAHGGNYWSEPKLATSTIILWLDDRLSEAHIGNHSIWTTGALGEGSYRVIESWGPATHSLKIGHSVFTVFFGLMGGWFGRWPAKRNEH
jgi:hypothetical protein